MISVYGSTGFIGSHYCDLYNDNVIRINRNTRDPQSKDILYFISTVTNYNVFDNPHLDINTNLNVLVETLESCRKKYNSDFVFNFISSWFVYGKTNDLPASENSHCNPKGFYSITKRAAEQILISYCETYNIKYRILRLSNVYGTKDNKASKQKNAFLYLAKEVIQNRDIKLYNEGKNIRDFLHVSDACNGINLVINKGHTNEIYNIGSGQPNNFIETMSYVKAKSKSISKFEFISPPEFHKVVQIQDMFLDTTKLKQLGFQQRISIWNGLDEIINNT
jgi:nucleoside-diphosphate-sugar epimerase